MRQKSLVRTILEPIAIAVALAVLVRAAVHIYSIPSASMAPTLEAGDQIVVTPYFHSDPSRGDVIVFRSPLDDGELMVKRVIGVPGDLVDSRMGRVRIGGYTLAEPYLVHAAGSGAIEAQVVPPGCYFVMGDNREDSLDSRSWGTVPRANVVGRARVILWGLTGDGVVHADSSSTRAPRTAPRSARLFKWVE
jgi:signal peptidase I